jgi:hypothetical protein
LLNVRGTGDPISSILKLTEANGWVAVDCSTSEFIDPANPSYEGWEGFQAFRDKAIGLSKRKKSESKAKDPKRKRKRKPSIEILSSIVLFTAAMTARLRIWKKKGWLK